MKKIFGLILALLLLCPTALAATHHAAVGEYGQETQFLISDEGEIFPIPEEFPDVYSIDSENGWFSATLIDENHDYWTALMNARGELVTDAVYAHISGAYADRIIFSVPAEHDEYSYYTLRGVMDGSGNTVVEPIYEDIVTDGADGFLAMLPGDSKLVLIDHDGNATKTDFYIAEYLFNLPDDGPLPVRETPNGPVGYIDRELNWVIPPQFYTGGFFNDGFAALYYPDRALLIDETGAQVLPEDESASWIEIGRTIIAHIYTDSTELSRVFTRSGDLLFTYDGSLSESGGGRFIGWENETGSCQLLNSRGIVIAQSGNGSFFSHSDESVPVYFFYNDEDGLKYLIDTDGAPLAGGYVSLSEGGVRSDGTPAFIAAEGRMLEDEIFGPYPDWNRMRYGLIDKNGNELLPFLYHELYLIPDSNFLIFEDAKSFGVIDADGNELLRISRYAELAD